MKRLYLLCTALLCLSFTAEAQTVEWVKRMTASSAQFANSLHTAPNGDFVITGYVGGNLNFGGGSVTGQGTGDAFVAKYNADGIFQWAGIGTGSGWNGGRGAHIDGNGNVYFVGRIQGSAMFGSTTVTSSGENDCFVAKYDPNGNFQWVRKFGGSGDDWAQKVTVDAQGNCYVTGFFTTSMNVGSTNFSSAGGQDMFLVSYSSNGSFRWAKTGGGIASDAGYDVETDGTNIYVGGYFSAGATFDGTTLTGSGTTEAFLLKYDGAGTLQWARGSQGNPGLGNLGESVAIGTDGNIYLAGSFAGSATFDSRNVISSSSSNIFITKYNDKGGVLSVMKIGSSGDDGVSGFGQSISIAPNPNGGFNISGPYNNSLTFGSSTVTSAGGVDIFEARYDENGAPLWAMSCGGPEAEGFIAIGVDSKGASYMFGNFFSGTFTCGSEQFVRQGGFADMFLAKITDDNAPQLPTASIDPGTLDFGNVVAGETEEKALTITPLNGAGLEITSVSLAGDAAASGFTITSPDGASFPKSLVFGEELEVVVSFTPPDETDYQTTLTIESNDAQAQEIVVDVEGRGTGLQPGAVVSTDALDFGQVAIGSPAELSFEVSGENSAGIRIDAIYFEDDNQDQFFITAPGGGYPINVPDGSVETVTVEFDPSVLGAAEGVLIIETNAWIKPFHRVDLTGTATDAVQPGAIFSRTALDFGEVETETSSELTFGITPANSAGLRIIDIRFPNSQTSMNGFTITEPASSSLPMDVAEGDALVVKVTFAPTEDGPAMANLIIESNDVATPDQQVSLTGTGTTETSSVDEDDANSAVHISVLPNPLVANGSIVITAPQTEEVLLRLFGEHGEEVLTESMVANASGTARFVLDATGYAAGTYFCVVEAAGERHVRTIQIVK